MTTTALSDTTPWSRVAARAVHPANPGLPAADGLLVDIAAGIGRVTVPVSAATSIQRELLLDSPAYEVWLMAFPQGTTTDHHAHPHEAAVHVVCGVVVHEHHGDSTELREGATVHVAADSTHALRCLEDATTIHVHTKEHL